VSVLVIHPSRARPEVDGLELVDEPGPDVEAALILTDAPFDAAQMDASPALKVIALGTIGYDRVDVEAAAARGIWVCNVPDYCVDEVAEHTLALLLALTRGVVALDRDVRAGRWDDHAAGKLRTLGGLRVGIVGHGRIGSAVARRLAALGCDLLVHDVRDVGVPVVPLAELLAESDVVTVHVPLTRQTTGLIGPMEIAAMRSGALLINTSRGRVVDFDAVVRALREGHLGGAALDVLPEEPPAELPQLPNLIVTPHAAWQSADAEARALAGAIAALRTALRGERPATAVPETP
jgi:D-3-phosphoglycerate dehydrogenase / 2-oxoglutarate reductase